MIVDRNFLRILRQKLKTGNRNSIHLNAIGGKYLTRLDLAGLNDINSQKAADFINTLLTKPKFDFELSMSVFAGSYHTTIEEHKKLILLSKRLDSISYENEDNFLEQGVKTFGFGYPILVKRNKKDPSQFIKAPLLIWALDIEKDTKQANRWIIRRDEDFPIAINEVLISHLEVDEEIKIERLPEELLDDSIISNEELVKICAKLLTQLNIPFSTESLDTLLVNPAKSTEIQQVLDEDAQERPQLLAAGAFGLYKTQKESIIRDMDALLQKEEALKLENIASADSFQKIPFAAVETDPSQQGILNGLTVSPNMVIQGPPGTGKSQTLTALITNALANKAKCLVVCEKKTALEVIENNLKALGLGQLCALVEDVSKDRRRIIAVAREKMEADSPVRDFESTFKAIAEKCLNTRDQVQLAHQKVGEQVFGEENRTSITGKYLYRSRFEDKNTLRKHLSYRDFNFSQEEHAEILEIIKKARPLFERANPLQHPLEVLDASVYSHETPMQAWQEVVKKAKNLEQEVQNAAEQADTAFNIYEHQIRTHYQNHHTELQEAVERISKSISANGGSFGNLFLRYDGFTNFKLKFRASLSKKYKKLLTEKLFIKEKYETLNRLHSEKSYFTYTFRKLDKKFSYTEIAEHTNAFSRDLGNWKKSWNDIIEQSKTVFSVSNIHPNIKLHEEAQILENVLAEALENINTSGLLKSETRFTSNVFRNQVQALKEIQITAENILALEHDFRDYYYWRNFTDNLNPAYLKLILALAETNPTDWISAFESWYFDSLLAVKEDAALPKDDTAIQHLAKDLDELKEKQVQRIISYWQNRKFRSMNAFESRKRVPAKSLYIKVNSKNHRKKSLRQIIEEDFELFTDLFPVILVNPSVCSSLLPLKENLFDLVIFDEASQLRLEDTFCALIRGRHKIISGDSQQMPPSSYFQSHEISLDVEEYTNDEIVNTEKTAEEIEAETYTIFQKEISTALAESESLLEYAENSHFRESFLKIHYRSRHPYLIDFSNAAFYGRKLNPMPAISSYKPIRFIQADGVFENQVNEREAEEVIRILRTEIQADFNGGLPSIGIATFNIHQRNFILDKIKDESLKDENFGLKIQKLYEKGLFVKNLENIQGDERDIMILSTTYGRKENGSFSERFGPLNNKKVGYKLLNVLITRAKQQVFVCTSIPQERTLAYQDLIPLEGNTGKACFYAYLAYARAIEQNNPETRQAILDLLYEHCAQKTMNDFSNLKSFELTESPFEQEVYTRLSNFIKPDRIKLQYQCAGFRIDMAILPENPNSGEPIIAIECDGASYHSSTEAYVWDIFRQKHLEKYGFTFYRIWSTNWWLNPEKEMENLLEFVRGNSNVNNQIQENINITELV